MLQRKRKPSKKLDSNPAETAGRRGKVDSRRKRDEQRRRLQAAKRSQSLLWYDALLESGVCCLGGSLYSITLRLSDINYQMATEEHQAKLLESYARFFNKFNQNEHLTITIVNRRIERDALAAKVLFPEPRYGDELTPFREDHNRIVRGKLGNRRYRIVAEKFVTLTVDSPSLEQAKASLDRLASTVINQMWSLLECQATRMNGVERIELLRELTRGCYASGFNYAAMAASGASTHDELAPMNVDLSNPTRLILSGDSGDLYCQCLVLRDYPAWMSDTLFTRLSEVQTDLVISFHATPIDRTESRQLVMKRKTSLDMERTAVRRKLLKSGMDPEYDMPLGMVNSQEEVRELLEDIDKADQRLFTTTLVVMVQAASESELAERVDEVRKIAKGESCELSFLKSFQEPAFNTALPLGADRLPFHRTLTTAAVAVMVPFTSQEILDDNGLFYGTNANTGNAIIMDRRKQRNGNAFILGTSGSGKSHFAKWEMSEVLVGRPNDDVIIIDPEREYRPLSEAFGATIVEVHAGSSQVINPFDLSMSSLEGDPVRLKIEALLGMLRVLLGGHTGLSKPEESVLDRCMTTLYARWRDQGGLTPTFQDLYQELLLQPEEHARSAAAALELYATGSFSGFAQQTNVDTSNRFVCYDTSRLGPSLQTFGLMVVLDQVWQRVQANYGKGIRTWLYIDEFTLMFTNPHAMQMLTSFYTRFRKYGGLPTGILQNVVALLEVPEARRMLLNSEVLFLLGQKEKDADELAEMLELSEDEIRAFTMVEPGCGLIRVGPKTLPFNGRKPLDGPLNVLFNTTFEEAG